MTNSTVPLRHVRITNSGKLSDRYVTAQTKVPSDPGVRARGQLFTIVEIENPWFPTSQIGQTIINTVAREYFRADGRDYLTDFEAALKKVNETLGHLVQTGETDWVGHLHAIVILVTGDELHIASVGGVHGWLLRSGKTTPAIERTKTVPAPEKTFSSVLSGVIEPGDRLVVASSGLLSVVSKAELETNIFQAKQFGVAAIRLANLLRSKRGQWVNALILELPIQSEAATRDEVPDVLYLDTSGVGDWRLTLGMWTSKAHHGIVSLGHRLRQLDSAINTTMRRHVLPRTQAGWVKTKAWSTDAASRFQRETLPRVAQASAAVAQKLKETTVSKATPSTTPAAPPVTSPSENLIGKSVFSIHDYQAATVPPGASASPAADPDHAPILQSSAIRDYQGPAVGPGKSSFTDKLREGLQGLGGRVARVPLWRSRTVIFGVLAVGLAIILITNLQAISVRNQAAQSAEQAQATLADLEDALEEAKLAKIFNQPDKARELLATVLAGTESLAGTAVATQADAVAAEAQTALDELTSTTRLRDLVMIAELSTTTSSFVRWGDLLTTIDPETKQVVSVPIGGGETSVLDVGDTAPIALTAYDEKTAAAILTKPPSVFELTAATGPLAALTPGDGAWQQGMALAPFFNNLYVLSPESKQIWRYTSTEGQLSAQEAYITDGTDVSAGVDLAIDGSVYVLTSTGEILKLSRGKREELAVRDLPKPNETLTNPRQIETTRDGDRLYVLDGTRIVALDKSGRFQAQYVPDGLDVIQSFSVDEAAKTLTVLSEGKLLRATLP